MVVGCWINNRSSVTKALDFKQDIDRVKSSIDDGSFSVKEALCTLFFSIPRFVTMLDESEFTTVSFSCFCLLYTSDAATLKLARPAGIEPATAGLEGRCSIRLSYGRSETDGPTGPDAGASAYRHHQTTQLVGAEGFEPPTSSSQSWRSTRLSYTPASNRSGDGALPRELS